MKSSPIVILSIFRTYYWWILLNNSLYNWDFLFHFNSVPKLLFEHLFLYLSCSNMLFLVNILQKLLSSLHHVRDRKFRLLVDLLLPWSRWKFPFRAPTARSQHFLLMGWYCWRVEPCRSGAILVQILWRLIVTSFHNWLLWSR
jgi:hypothetical protein